MSDETGTTSEVARVLGLHYPDQTSYDAGDLQGCMCGWQVPAPRTYGESDWAAYYAHQAAMLAEAELLATGEHLAWERGYTWGHNDEQNGTETRNPYPAQIAAQEPAGATQAGSGDSRMVGGLDEGLTTHADHWEHQRPWHVIDVAELPTKDAP